MFSSGNCGIPAVMNVEPTGGGCYNGGMNGFGGDWIWILVVFALLFGWGNNGWGGNGGNGGAVPYMVGSTYTDAAIQRGFDNQSVINKLNGIEQGICSLGYDNLAQMNNLGMAVANGFHGVDNAICNLGYTTQQGFNATQVAMLQGQNALQAQLAQCCCDNRVGQMQIQNQMQADTCAITNQANVNTRDIIESNNAGFRAILDKMCQQELAAKDATIAAQNQKIFGLELSASQAAQNAYITANQSAQTAELIRRLGADCPVNAVVVQPNTPVTFPTNCCGGVNFAGYGNGYNNGGCGCNSGCC